MERIQRTITEKLLNKLPSDLEYIDPQWLGGFGIPGFLVSRIKFELHKNLGDSIVPPKTDWADMDAKPVRAAWARFIEAIEAETRLPSVFAGSVIESAVGDLLDILVEPRKNLPDYLFGNDKTLDFKEASERAETIVVYTHFGQHLPNYMRRKQLDFIDRERFSSFISQLDEKLTTQYSPLNWAQLLAPLFELNDQLVDSELLVRFFRDKNRVQLAALFERTNGAINQTQFIEMLSAPAVDHVSDSETSITGTPVSAAATVRPPAAPSSREQGKTADPVEQSIPAEPEAEPASVTVTATGQPDSTSDEDPDTSQDKTIPSVQENIGPADFEDDTTTDLMAEQSRESDSASEKTVTEAENKKKTEPSPLWQQFSEADDTVSDHTDEPARDEIVEKSVPQADKSDVKPEFLTKPEPEDHSMVQAESVSQINYDEERPLVERFIIEESAEVEPSDSRTEETAEDIPESTGDSNAENLPMWKRFISAATSVRLPEMGKGSEEKLLSEKFTHKDDEEDYELDLDISNPLRIDEIKKTLDDKKKYYIKRFFKDDQAAFNTVIRDLAEMETWSEAGPYITKNVFKKNKIDPYSDEAVNFIDRLQSYFNSHIKK
jgi:hypothetical protein